MDTVRKVADALGISVRQVLQRPISRFVIVTEGHGTILCRVSKGNIVAGQEVTLWHDKEEHHGEAVCSDFPMYEMERVKSVCKHFGTTYFKLPCAMAKEKKNGAAEEEKQQDGDGDVRERERENHADAVHGGGGAADQ